MVTGRRSEFAGPCLKLGWFSQATAPLIYPMSDPFQHLIDGYPGFSQLPDQFCGVAKKRRCTFRSRKKGFCTHQDPQPIGQVAHRQNGGPGHIEDRGRTVTEGNQTGQVGVSVTLPDLIGKAHFKGYRFAASDFPCQIMKYPVTQFSCVEKPDNDQWRSVNG